MLIALAEDPSFEKLSNMDLEQLFCFLLLAKC